jgi:cysteine-rich repeat protein
VKLKRGPYGDDPVIGPVAFIETRMRVGSIEYCGRWEQPPATFRKNDASRVVIKGPSVPCQTACGNSIVELPETCDDGNLVDGDGCDPNCTVTACGNGVQTAGEACDDGDAQTGDGCRPDCTLELCGDGILDPQDACDDGNTEDGDCCAADCTLEAPGSACTPDLNVCTDDECDGAGTCVHLPNAAPCSDDDGCTVDDVCAAGSCAGTLRPPWINEFDYDDFTGVLDDRDEFIEIAGPAGTSLGGYQIVNVEGGSAGPPCSTPPIAPFVAVGEANLLATIPGPIVLGDDTGTGIGFLVVCFTNSSANVVNLPACDVVLAAPRTDSNLTNGALGNGNLTCPDGIVLLDALGGLVDAVSYEGIVPNVGTWGSYFHATTPYSAPRDEGWLTGVSIEKTSSTLERAQDASEWRDPSETAICVGQLGVGQPAEPRTVTVCAGTAQPPEKKSGPRRNRTFDPLIKSRNICVA